MRTSVLIFLAALSLAMAPAQGEQINLPPDLTIALDSTVGTGVATNLNNADAGGYCPQPNCVLFTGTLLDNDDDLSVMDLYSIGISFSDSNPSSGFLTLDSNLFYSDVPAPLIGDPDWAANSVNDGGLQNFYYGPVFGIDIAPGTPLGEYNATITLTTYGGTNDTGSGQTFSQDITVNVNAPEPSAISLLFAGSFPLTAWLGRKRLM